MKPHSHKSHHNSWVQSLGFPAFLSSEFTLQESCEHATPREVCPGPSGAPSTGWKQALLPLSFCLDNSLTYTENTLGFCLSRPLLSCSQLQAIGLLCTKTLEEWHRCVGVRGFLPWQNDVSVYYEVASGALLGHPRH